MSRLFVSTFVLVSALASLFGATASAQDQAPSRRVLVLSAGGDARLARSAGASARDRAIATLGARGLVAARGPAGCSEPDCATELLAGGAAEYALALSLWGRARCERVAVALVDAHGVAHPGEVSVTGTDVNAAIDGAIDAALAHLADGGSSLLGVTGAPAGATITLDQIPWGTLPHEDRVPRGEHQLAVSAEGHTTERRSVTIGGEPVSLSIELQPIQAPVEAVSEPITPPIVPPPRGSDDGGLVLTITGGALAGLGAIAAGVGIAGLAMGDSGTPMAPDFVYERSSIEASIGWLVAGGVGLAAGVVLLVVGATSGQPARPAEALRRPSLFTF